ncbi:MAG: DNA polymerase III subunit delta [Patescibacteria group bacterium]
MNYLITGDSYLISVKLSQLKSMFLEAHPNGLIENVDPENISLAKIEEILGSTSLFSADKLVIVKGLGSNKNIASNIEQIFESIVDGTELVLVEKTLDKRSIYYKFLNSDKRLEHHDLTPNNVEKWVTEQVAQQAGKISQTDVKYLIEAVGSQPEQLFFEIQKLIFYSPNITKETIDLLIQKTLTSSVFDLVNAIFTQGADRATKLYDQQRFLGTEPVAIIGMIAWQLHLLALTKTGDKNSAEIARETKINPYSLSQSASISNNLSLGDINQMIKTLNAIDYKSKTSPINIDEALKTWITVQAN